MGNKDDSNNPTLASSNGCPVAKDATVDQGGSSSHSWASWFGWRSSSNDGTVINEQQQLPSGCPVSSSASDGDTRDTQGKLPASLEEAAAYAQTPHPDQKGIPLSTQRMISSIPRGATETKDEPGPHHQPTTSMPNNNNNNSGNACKTATSSSSNQPSHWMYPSEQQFFHALRKKGWDQVEAESIPSVLQIHNTINERTWNQIQEWEAATTMDIINNNDNNNNRPQQDAAAAVEETDLKLVRFMGRPNDMSPQAFIWTKIFQWADPPFDRHDWYVQKQPRQQQHASSSSTTKSSSYPIQRYVIDYYMFPPLHPEMPPTPYVDARPALDSPRAFYLRAVRLLQEELPGITSEYQAWRAHRRKCYYDGSLPTTTSSN